jgi:hypothetical protein
MMLSLYDFEAVNGNRKFQISALAVAARDPKQGASSHRAALRQSI